MAAQGYRVSYVVAPKGYLLPIFYGDQTLIRHGTFETSTLCATWAKFDCLRGETASYARAMASSILAEILTTERAQSGLEHGLGH